MSIDTDRFIQRMRFLVSPPTAQDPGARVTVQNGDKVWTPARMKLGNLRHYGIWDEESHAFIHNTPGGGVQLASPDEFINGQFWIELRAAPGFEREVVHRARGFLGRPYDLLSFNCEHLVNYAAEGVLKSPQLAGAVAGAAFGGGLAMMGFGIFSAFLDSKPRFDASVGRFRDSRGRFVRS